MNVTDLEIKDILLKYKKISVYGLSGDPLKPSHYVPVYMREKGWEIVGTYPKKHEVGGFKIYEKLIDIPKEDRKFVDVFRRSERIPDLVDEVLALGDTEILWLQLGISHPEAELRAEKSGIRVISNRCLIIEHRKHF